MGRSVGPENAEAVDELFEALIGRLVSYEVLVIAVGQRAVFVVSGLLHDDGGDNGALQFAGAGLALVHKGEQVRRQLDQMVDVGHNADAPEAAGGQVVQLQADELGHDAAIELRVDVAVVGRTLAPDPPPNDEVDKCLMGVGDNRRGQGTRRLNFVIGHGKLPGR